MKYILERWCHFANVYSHETGDSVDHITWRISSKPHSRQEDSDNCGVYCLLFAERHIKSEDLMHIYSEDLQTTRKQIGSEIMLYEVFLTDCCPKCGCSIDHDHGEKLQCDSCGRCYHFKSYCVLEDLNDLEDSESFVCRMCKLNFWPEGFFRSPAADLEGNSRHNNEKVQWTSKVEIIKRLNETDSCDLDCQILENKTEETGSVKQKIQQVDSTTVSARPYDLRDPPPKKKRWSSFIYKTPRVADKAGKKVRRTGKTTVHLEKLQMKGTKTVKPKHRKVKYTEKRDRNADQGKPQTYKDDPAVKGLIDDKESEEERCIMFSTAFDQIDAAISRVEELIGGQPQKGERWRARHDKFRNGSHQDRTLVGYGFSCFSQKARLFVRQTLRNQFLYKDKNKTVTGIWFNIKGMSDSVLLDSFNKEKNLASFYMDEVCLKEGLAAILEKVLGMDYNEADNACRQTESNSLLKSMEMAKKLCNQITCMDTMAKKASDSKCKAAESPEMDKTFPRLRRRASLPDLQDSFKSHPSI